MNRTVAVLNLWNNGMVSNARESIQRAAARWNADYVEFTNSLSPRGDAWLAKMQLDRMLRRRGITGRVVYFDRDIVVRSDCPNLLELVGEHRFGAVPHEQEGHNYRTHIEKGIAPVCKSVGVILNVPKHYFQAGMMVFNLARHACLFRMIRELSRQWDYKPWEISDQGLLAVALRKLLPLDLQMLPVDFNRCGPPCWNEWTATAMPHYVMHFSGNKRGRDWKIAMTQWRIPSK